MNCHIMGLRVDHRRTNAPKLQKTLTHYGCNIKMRVGLHQAGELGCSDDGLIVLQVCGKPGEAGQMLEELNGMDGVTAKLMEI
ncbi:hypothetical protein [Acutalibacter intestini]|uniref:hypothetical protein n=1 Tax=Acutalibacter intestini TaxID=3093659 RepID=UPI00216C5E7C|nr:hypothetical protein [Acutalibacter sp. M00204]MCI9552218.1 hypothetical protein [Acutalibacter sp.]